MRPVACHICARMENERSVYSSFTPIDAVRFKLRSIAVWPMLSALMAALPQGKLPNPKNVAPNTLAASQRCGRVQPDSASDAPVRQ